MFAHAMQEQQPSVIQIDDLSAYTVQSMLEFLYTGHTPLATWEHAADMVHAAEKYALQGMVCKPTL